MFPGGFVIKEIPQTLLQQGFRGNPQYQFSVENQYFLRRKRRFSVEKQCFL
jgi:hypothetical protein